MRRAIGLVVVVLAACGGGGGTGAPIAGDVRGTFDGAPFVPRYGVALDLASPDDHYGAFEIQLSEVEVSCSAYLSGTTWAGEGLYARIFLNDAMPGSYTDRHISIDHIKLMNNLIAADPGVTSDTASGTVTVADAMHVEGTVSFDPMISFDVKLSGSFSVARCP